MVITSKNLYGNGDSLPEVVVDPSNALQEKLAKAMTMVSTKSELYRLLSDCLALTVDKAKPAQPKKKTPDR